MSMQGLDRHITGNWGEDSAAPEFIRAEDLDQIEVGAVIDLTVIGEATLAVTVLSVEAWTGGHWLLHTKEMAYPFLITADCEPIYYTEKEN